MWHILYRINKALLGYSPQRKLVTAALLLGGEIAKWLRMLVTLEEDLASVLRTHMVADNSLYCHFQRI